MSLRVYVLYVVLCLCQVSGETRRLRLLLKTLEKKHFSTLEIQKPEIRITEGNYHKMKWVSSDSFNLFSVYLDELSPRTS